MSNPLPGNPFIDEAARDDYETVDGIGNAQATLALAYEQRTANLIAMMAQMDLAGGTEEQIKRAYELVHQVEERLNIA